MTRTPIHNYVNDGTTLEQMALALEAMSALTSVCSEVNEDRPIPIDRFAVLLDVLLLRLEQVYEKLADEEDARRALGMEPVEG
ncbi:hypothetical protein NX722_25295 [Endozoicomonas gorgoniicola]|uniref:Uncharacterized protein n=1 Tax=Endozoicomonas gorgoniicola TaxID=1234144 RepID=A0ABT3N3G9_9GAMM|nr:hypothetical protein [Endozoicomonas gorgoniicola]MCW7555883.1 hypothetical protein [Endozoicomonas gorgoniicola]